MVNSFSDFDIKAFSPFFDIPIAVEGERSAPEGARRIAGTFMACVFDNGFADPFADADAETSIRTYSVSVIAGDWLEKKPPQTGDRIAVDFSGGCSPTLPSMKLSVSRVDQIVGDTWTFTAKEVK